MKTFLLLLAMMSSSAHALNRIESGPFTGNVPNSQVTYCTTPRSVGIAGVSYFVGELAEHFVGSVGVVNLDGRKAWSEIREHKSVYGAQNIRSDKTLERAAVLLNLSIVNSRENRGLKAEFIPVPNQNLTLIYFTLRLGPFENYPRGTILLKDDGQYVPCEKNGLY